MHRTLALLPGQTMETPATAGTAVMVFVQLAFESFTDVVNLIETLFYQQLAGLQRTLAATANQHNRCILPRRPEADATEHDLAYLGDEVGGVYRPFRRVNPRYMDAAGRMPNEQVFHAGAYINQHRSLVVADNFRLLLIRINHWRWLWIISDYW